MGFPATSERVAAAWIRGIPEFAAAGASAPGVATTLPDANNECWSGSGFIRVQAVGGARNGYVPMKSPVVSVDCFAMKLDSMGRPSSKPPWERANRIAEVICFASLPQAGLLNKDVNPGTNYNTACVKSVTVLSEPRRMPGDVSSNLAQYQFDVQIDWV